MSAVAPPIPPLAPVIATTLPRVPDIVFSVRCLRIQLIGGRRRPRIVSLKWLHWPLALVASADGP
jgi:hypothetical protein